MSAVTKEVVNQANGHLNGSAAMSESSSEDAVRAQVHDKAMRARQAAAPLRTLSTEVKNHALLLMADKLVQRAEEISAPTRATLKRAARVV
jgi:glutamate-5-semialdehyde dehydrogenase